MSYEVLQQQAKNDDIGPILIGRKALCAYLGGVTWPVVLKFIKMGMPATVIDGRWYAHTANINEFFRRITRVQMKEVPENAE